jgi:hypothetical protein
MNVKVVDNTKVPNNTIPSVIPNDAYVDGLRSRGFEVHVFQNSKRRMVAVKVPFPEDKYDTYDSELAKHERILPLKELTKRDIEALKEDPTFAYDGPWVG